MKNSSIWYSFFTLSFQTCPKDIDWEDVALWNVINNEYALYEWMNISDASQLTVLAEECRWGIALGDLEML